MLNEAADRLYVATRFDNAISVIDTTAATEVEHHSLHNPEPAAVVSGRHVLYDAQLSSSNGEAACASCHIFADFDSLAWDLGNPDDVLLNNPNPFEVGSGAPFHPMKGPMTTQSLRGMANHGPMHWRGDRTGGNDPGGSGLDENAAFNKFIVAFDGLLGRGAPIDHGGHAGVHRLHPAGDLPAEPDPRPRQHPHPRAAGGQRHLLRPDHRRRPQLQWLPRAQSGGRLLRRQRQIVDRGRAAGVQDPAPAQPVPEGRHVRDAGGALLQARRQRPTRASRCADSASCTTAASTRSFASTAPTRSPSARRRRRTSSSSCSRSTRT